MLSEITVEAIGYAFVVTGLFLSIGLYIATIAHGVNRLEKSVEELQALVAKHSRKKTSHATLNKKKILKKSVKGNTSGR